MPLALSRTGVVFKKCGMAGHKPDSNKACAAGTCQHTCTDIERCSHAWTLRYWADGKQRERSFKDEVRHGRTAYGSGKKLAQDAQLKLTVDKRAGDKTFADYSKAGKANFGEAAEAFIARLQVNDRSRDGYLSAYNKHVGPVFGGRTLAQVANDRDGVLDLLTVAMAGLSVSPRRQARMVIEGTLDEAVKAGKLREHRVGGIELPDNGTKHDRTDFVFPSHAQVVRRGGRGGHLRMADARVRPADRRSACGQEAGLPRERHDLAGGVPGDARRFTDGAAEEAQGRRVPRCPGTDVAMGHGPDLADGPLTPGNGERTFQLYGTIYRAVHERRAERGDTGRVHAALAAPRVRVRNAEQGRPDHRRSALAGTPGRTGDVPDLRSSRAVCCGPRDHGTG